MKKLPPEQQKRVDEEAEIMAFVFCLAVLLTLALLFVHFFPAIAPTVDAVWNWFLNFEGIW